MLTLYLERMTLEVTTCLSLEEANALRWAVSETYHSCDKSNTWVNHNASVAMRVVGRLDHDLYERWKGLPDGDHLKEAYRDEVWTLDDTDLKGGE